MSPRPIDIAEQLRAMERLVASIAGRDVTVSLSIDASDTVAIIDPSAFESILVQIAQNAREAMPTGGSLKIECHGVRGDDAVALDKNTAVPGGDWVRIRVQDNGTGVEPALAGRVFEPFFTTKPPGTGLGLGLSTAYGIVKQANGFIAFESEPGVGTAVTIWLPMPDRGIDDDLDTDPALDAREQGTVVVVQPDVVFRNAIVLALRQQGFDVVEVGAAHDALHLTPSVWSCARLVVAEADMPQLSGVELARRVSGLAPGVRVLFTATKPIGTSGVAIPDGATCLAMPLTPASLVAKVRELLAPGG